MALWLRTFWQSQHCYKCHIEFLYSTSCRLFTFLLGETLFCREASVPSLLYHFKNSELNLIQENIDNLKTVGAESTTESVNCFVPSNMYDKSDE